MDQVVDRQSDGKATSDQERGNRGQESPHETDTAVAEGVLGIRRSPCPAEGDAQKHLIGGVRNRVSGFGEKRGRAGDQSAGELGHCNE
jgi:hypothetical protein